MDFLGVAPGAILGDGVPVGIPEGIFLGKR